MTEFLLFTIYAPFASWGEVAVGEVRESWDRPSRSATLGLFAAALGIERADQEAHDTLDAALGIAVRADAPGIAMVDYHTVQTVPATLVRRYKPVTRAESLALGDVGTIVSRRTLYQDALATVAVWERKISLFTLAIIADALRRPKYCLYAGRKANAFGLPFAPQFLAADSLADAFAQREQIHPILNTGLHLEIGGEIAHDPCEGFASGLRFVRREIRRDAAPHRSRWQFAERVVEIGIAESERA